MSLTKNGLDRILQSGHLVQIPEANSRAASRKSRVTPHRKYDIIASSRGSRGQSESSGIPRLRETLPEVTSRVPRASQVRLKWKALRYQRPLVPPPCSMSQCHFKLLKSNLDQSQDEEPSRLTSSQEYMCICCNDAYMISSHATLNHRRTPLQNGTVNSNEPIKSRRFPRR